MRTQIKSRKEIETLDDNQVPVWWCGEWIVPDKILYYASIDVWTDVPNEPPSLANCVCVLYSSQSPCDGASDCLWIVPGTLTY